ncbi:hypothetical protein HMPREF9318_01732 [Streptococcus urinalis FB127-CNA-2]|uniref:FR47-like protein n=1 Tax=Streptococcus urinalis 2285-97 TaxID=764291 RepID=G5KEB5_9STRE|nr:GNAT family N-acetyltransferase [Streptococcus urinalis]EHJ57072.1 FR47-like protein [Streptococcus urinalis 2285-97]EKS18233.1 hypothetical protein HMPREF9318_01732 [Streptococcus urinalis FB127-CNA-2]VEF32892.1 acetyltransferase, GNAT family [Streptococcus urinalis]
MQIRTIQEKDFDQVLEIENSVWTPYNSPVYDRVLTKDDLRKRIGDRAHILVADDNGIIAGCLPYNPMYPFPQGQHVCTFGLAIHPDFQGKGIGRQLIEGLFETAKQNHFSQIAMHVTGGNKTAISLYQKMGFQLECQLTNHLCINGIYHDALIFNKSI